MRFILLILMVVLQFSHAHAQNGEADSIKAQNYFLAKKMAECAAFFDFGAILASSTGKYAVAEHADNKARGWRLAGIFFMSQSIDGGDVNRISFNVENIELSKLSELRSYFELNGYNESYISAIFNEQCIPYAQIQENVINAIRGY